MTTGADMAKGIGANDVRSVASRKREPIGARNEPGISEHQGGSKLARLRRRFIETDASLRALAPQHGVPYSTAKRRARKENWKAKRQAYRDELDRQLDQATLVSRTESHAIQERAARETIQVFARVFAEEARAIRVEPRVKNAADRLSRLIQLQLDVSELSLTILGDIESDAQVVTTLSANG